ncbi:NgoMIV family type II restriction endonuclease [Slackia exigua]|uniref:NgoMIV family type II restriction endonuclease n=1 Tax=Slackia exigua TaxID=84109 RepID=UPI002006A1A6|nr:NgoMIV family type II restriction endonuclease [Slackia exigua]MCK6139741.1 NgoMIV family type II restriction endonuclease [Slackia exigua]
MNEALIDRERERFHRRLIETGLLVLDEDVASNADKDSRSSKEIGYRLALILDVPQGKKLKGQTAGAVFEQEVADYVSRTFREFQHLRPGTWDVRSLGNRGHKTAEGFAQYEHLSHLADMMQRDPELKMSLGNDYVVSPDVVVSRGLLFDEDINAGREFISDKSSLKADLRMSNDGKPILHASISAKWTIRSDRAQNSRTEALNLIRNRKGHLPHIVVVTAEPLPSRLASLAMGTGDIDCVYHVALYELLKAIEAYSATKGVDDSLDEVYSLVIGKRLKDISDLPLDLCV